MRTEVDFPSKIENISIAENLIDNISSEYKLSTEIYGNILVAIIEAVNNAILHGNKLDPDKNVFLSYVVDNKVLSFIIRDEGGGFDFDNVPDPTSEENIEKPHGRGIFLMKHLADDISFDENGSAVELKFNLV
ncbi:MAG: ATP-binding protein [Marinilabiliales bacterium]|nr:MAG: ATP-binding protein [Marinilabiliales bacterium]